MVELEAPIIAMAMAMVRDWFEVTFLVVWGPLEDSEALHGIH